MFLDPTLTTTIFGVPITLLFPDTGLLMPPWQPCSSYGFFFFFYLLDFLRQRKLEMTPIKVKAMQKGAVSLFFLNQSYMLLLALIDHAEVEGNKICFITHFHMIDPSRAISEAVSIPKNT